VVRSAAVEHPLHQHGGERRVLHHARSRHRPRKETIHFLDGA
jgi:hypothetical protein